MTTYILRRLAVAIPTILVLIVLTFCLMYAAPGTPFTTERGLPPEIMANLDAKYGLDQPFVVQMWRYVTGILFSFDFGPSYYYTDQSVADIITQGFPVTLTYGFWAFVMAATVGIGLGIAAAIFHNSWLDYLAVGISIGAQVLPNFIMAPVLILIFAVWLNWLPGGGWNGGAVDHVILPVVALATSFMASIARLTRSSMLEVMNTNFIRTARAKGLPMRRVVIRHALKPALLPVISYLGPTFVGMITGSVVIDVIFSTGGIGMFMVNAAFNRDYPVIMAITVLTGVLTILFSLLVDILYAWIDPKIRY